MNFLQIYIMSSIILVSIFVSRFSNSQLVSFADASTGWDHLYTRVISLPNWQEYMYVASLPALLLHSFLTVLIIALCNWAVAKATSK